MIYNKRIVSRCFDTHETHTNHEPQTTCPCRFIVGGDNKCGLQCNRVLQGIKFDFEKGFNTTPHSVANEIELNQGAELLLRGVQCWEGSL